MRGRPDGRRGRGVVPGHARHGGVGARLLEAVPRRDGPLSLDGAATFHRVSALHAAYARALDDDRFEAWPELFLDRCLYKVTSAENHREGLEAGLIYADSRAMLKDRVAALREANIYERQSYRHILGAPGILADADGATTAETSFLVVRIMHDGRMDLFATGRYLDVIRIDEADGCAKFAERIVVCDSSRVDTLLAIPL